MSLDEVEALAAPAMRCDRWPAARLHRACGRIAALTGLARRDRVGTVARVKAWRCFSVMLLRLRSAAGRGHDQIGVPAVLKFSDGARLGPIRGFGSAPGRVRLGVATVGMCALSVLALAPVAGAAACKTGTAAFSSKRSRAVLPGAGRGDKRPDLGDRRSRGWCEFR